MAQLVVMICMLSTPDKCSEMPVPGAVADDIVTCLKSAGDKADAWQKANSQYFVIGWRCQKQDKK
ncbi:MAG: hypothetical protein ACREDO_06895 [Methyloceanibacter sp.]